MGGKPPPPLSSAGHPHGVAGRPLPAATAAAGAQLVQRTDPRAGGMMMANTHTHATLSVGAGFRGLGAAVKLAQAGIADLVLERSDQGGGTGPDTSYPGASCDIPSLLYSFSFLKNPSWSRTYSPAEEIRDHLEEIADRVDIRR